jgi:DNA polymerase III subunit beta
MRSVNKEREDGMKLSIQREGLLKALQRICNIIGSRTTLPVLANVLIEAEGSKVSLTTTDLELRLTTSVDAKIEQPGRTTLPAKRLLGLVSKFKGDSVDFHTNEKHHTEIKSGTASFTLLGLGPEDFPVQPEFTAQRKLKIKQVELARIIDRISYAVSLDDSRKVLHGLLLSVKEGNLTAVATDGKRLALVEKLLEEAPSGSDGDIIITQKCATEAKRIIEKDGDAFIEIGERQVLFRIGSTIMTSKLIEGNYPNYRQVIPANFNKKIKVPSNAFIDALEIVTVPLFDDLPCVKLTFAKNKLVFESNSANVGEGKESIDIEFADADIVVSFNSNLLSDPFKHLDVESVNLKMNDAFSPIAIESGDGFLYVIMPMRNK